jgi:hypothetical protein
MFVVFLSYAFGGIHAFKELSKKEEVIETGVMHFEESMEGVLTIFIQIVLQFFVVL